MFLGDLGRTSIGTYYEIWMDGRKYAEGASKMVWINRGTGRSTPLPNAIAALLRVDGRAESMTAAATRLWTPAPQQVAQANLTAFAAKIGARHGVDVTTYDALWRWSIDHKADFWREVWDDAGRHRHARRNRAGGWRPDARCAMVSRRQAQLCAEPARAQARRRRKRCARVLGRGQGQRAGSRISNCTRWLRARRRRSRRTASWPATASPPTFRTCPKPSSRCWAPSAAARSGRRARRSSACRACWTASARSSRGFSSPSTATGTTARRSRSSTRSRTSSRGCRRWKRWS